jgi:ankyrin repeat protein
MSLHEALIARDVGKVRRLIRLRTGINTLEYGESPLMLAVVRPGNEYLTQLLLTAGAHVDMQNEVGETAFMLAMHFADNQGNIDILLHAGANTSLKTKYGYYASDYALPHSAYDRLFPENSERRVIKTVLANADLTAVREVCRKLPPPVMCRPVF